MAQQQKAKSLLGKTSKYLNSTHSRAGYRRLRCLPVFVQNRSYPSRSPSIVGIVNVRENRWDVAISLSLRGQDLPLRGLWSTWWGQSSEGRRRWQMGKKTAVCNGISVVACVALPELFTCQHSTFSNELKYRFAANNLAIQGFDHLHTQPLTRTGTRNTELNSSHKGFECTLPLSTSATNTLDGTIS